ncbi:MAG: hypothetical protein GXP42_11380 [Chloroflexi bacterium]|nr:hypothetical protein [Chloroflexota bacterium]
MHARRRARWKRLRQLAQAFFLLLGLLFLGLLLIGQWDQLRAYPWRLRPTWLMLAALALALSWALEVFIWTRLLSLLGGKLSFGYGFRIWFISALIRYIPGNVWQPLGMTVLAYRRGVRPEATVASIALYQVVNLLAAALIAALYFPLFGNLGLLAEFMPSWSSRPLALMALPALLFVIQPRWLIQLLNRGLAIIGRPPLALVMSARDVLLALALESLAWLLLATSFLALTMAITPLDLAELRFLAPHLLAGYPIAYAIGYLSFITPSGLAVREGALYVLLTPLLGGALVTAAALAMRVWLTLAELMAAAVSALTWPGLIQLQKITKTIKRNV